MSQTTAYGSITVVDVSDAKEFSVQPMSNLPLVVIYDPLNTSNPYNPNWGTTNLLVTPVIYYGTTPLTPGTTQGLSVEWRRQEGTGAFTQLTTGETVTSAGGLSVTANKFSTTVSLLTYRVTATYLEPTIGTTLTAQGQITFSKLENAGAPRNVQLIGDSIFKYNENRTITGASAITLTADVSGAGVSVSNWEYLDANNTWQPYPGATSAATLIVNATDSTFVYDKCVVRVNTNYAEVYDVHTITKLYDGAPGTNVISAILSNENQMIPVNDNVPDYSSAVSTITIYQEGEDVTSDWTIALEYDHNNLTVSQSTSTGGATGDTATVTAMVGQSGNVTFRCTYNTANTYDDVVKTFSLIKIESGADGQSPTVYSIEPNALAINLAADGTYTPASLVLNGYQQKEGNKTAYSGRFKVMAGTTTVYQSGSNESSKFIPCTDFPPGVKELSCTLYKQGGFTDVLDSQTVVVTTDGASAINVILGNYADVLACSNENALLANQTITVPFAAYRGTSRIACTLTSINFLGVAPTSNTPASTSADGSIVWTLPKDKVITDTTGTIDLVFSAGGITVTSKYSWSRSNEGAGGENSVLLQVFAPGGNIFTPPVTSITMESLLLDGSQEVTATAYQWYKWQGGNYSAISGATSSTLTIQSSAVDSYASYRLTATYNGKSYNGYYSLFDKGDPLQVTVLSSLGTQLVNGDGSGAVYVKVSQGGEEVDALKSERFLYEDPTTAATGDYYYKLSTANKSVTLMRYDGSAWVVATDSYTGSYRWTWRDKDGNPITEWASGMSLPTSGKVIYMDGDMINQKIIGDVAVEI